MTVLKGWEGEILNFDCARRGAEEMGRRVIVTRGCENEWKGGKGAQVDGATIIKLDYRRDKRERNGEIRLSAWKN